MRKQCLVLGAGLMVMVLVGPGVGQGPAPKGKPEDEGFTGKAIAVHFKATQPMHFLVDPKIRTFGGQHTFLIGRSANRNMKVWVPLGDVAKIEEFADIAELAQTYRIDGGPRKTP